MAELIVWQKPYGSQNQKCFITCPFTEEIA